MSEATADWDEIAGGKAFISDTGAEVKATVSGGASMT